MMEELCIIRIENNGCAKRKEHNMIIHDKNNYVDMMYKVLEALGYQDLKKNSDESVVNILAKKAGKIYAFACRYDIDAISGPAMEEFVEAVKKPGIDVAVFMTNSSFSSAAKKAGEAAGIELWDRNYIDRMAIGVDVELEKPVIKKSSSNKTYVVLIAAVVIVLVVALLVYFAIPMLTSR